VFYVFADTEISLSSRKTDRPISSPTWWFLTICLRNSWYRSRIRDIEAEFVILQQNIPRSRINIIPALVKFVCTWNMQGTSEQDSEGRALESPSNWSKVSNSTYVLGLDEIESNKNEMSPSNDRNNIGIETQCSVDSSPLRSPMDSVFADDHRQLLGGHHSASRVNVSPTWGGRTGNFSSKSSSSIRRYNFQYSKFVATCWVLPNTQKPLA
jgi:hypothetical protein